jgi:hypothetical protein
MTCRHSPGDPACSSNRPTYYDPPAPKTPDAEKYTIEDVARVGANLVLKVNYPNCVLCAYEGTKVLVFLNVTELEALRWKRIDPHFRAPSKVALATEAPSPAARFPASDEGWKDALEYAKART